MIKGHKIQRKIEIKDFLDIIDKYNENQIITTGHTFFRLAQKDRNIFKDKILKEFIKGQNPILVGLQYNGNYATFYKYEKSVLKIILDIQSNKINIVTFYIIDYNKIPRI